MMAEQIEAENKYWAPKDKDDIKFNQKNDAFYMEKIPTKK